MKSPFPGMDPYLEEHWRDIHHRFLTYACDELQEHLPRDLRARLEERVFVEPEFGDGRGIYPDVRVVEYPKRGGGTALATEVAAAEPLVIHGESEPATEGYIEIIDVGSGNRVVTVLELLSDSNKQPGEGQDLYRKKQRECLQGRRQPRRDRPVAVRQARLGRAGWTHSAITPHHVSGLRDARLQTSILRSVSRSIARAVAGHSPAVASGGCRRAAEPASPDGPLLSPRPL